MQKQNKRRERKRKSLKHTGKPTTTHQIPNKDSSNTVSYRCCVYAYYNNIEYE